jgi:hypothetical protein
MLSAKFTRFLLFCSTLTRKAKEQVSYIYNVSDLRLKALDSNFVTGILCIFHSVLLGEFTKYRDFGLSWRYKGETF